MNLKSIFSPFLILLFIFSSKNMVAQVNTFLFDNLEFRAPYPLKDGDVARSSFSLINQEIDLSIEVLQGDEYPRSNLAEQKCYVHIDEENLGAITMLGRLNDIGNSCHAIGYDEGGSPVIIGVILDEEETIGYSIFLYCEEMTEEEGFAILSTFNFNRT